MAGNLIIIKHSGGWITAYAHLSQSKVKRGEKIKKDQTRWLVWPGEKNTGYPDKDQSRENPEYRQPRVCHSIIIKKFS